MAKMILVQSTNMNGDYVMVGINPADISAIKERPNDVKGSIIERISQPQFAVWSIEPMADIYAKLVAVGVEVGGL